MWSIVKQSCTVYSCKLCMFLSVMYVKACHLQYNICICVIGKHVIFLFLLFQSSHLAMIDTLMMAYTVEMVSVERVLTCIQRFTPLLPEEDFPYDAEEAITTWINKVRILLHTLSTFYITCYHLQVQTLYQMLKANNKWCWYVLYTTEKS